MRHLALALGVTAAVCGPSACTKQVSDKDAIRAGIQQHLTSIGTLNPSAMEMDFRSVSVDGHQAHAEVQFRPKTGGAPGAGMQVAYNLEKRDGTWVVVNSQTLGGTIQHPDSGKTPPMNPDVHSGVVPNFNEILNPSGGPGPRPLSPGHPPVDATKQRNPPAAKSQPSTNKPQ